MNNLKDLIKEFRELKSKSIQGNWTSDFCGNIYSTAIINDDPANEGLHSTVLRTSFGPDDGTAVFVAYSANNITKLLDEVEVLIAENRKLKAMVLKANILIFRNEDWGG